MGNSIDLDFNSMCKTPAQGIFVSTENQCMSWIPFKYEKLPTFCFGCSLMGHELTKCLKSTPVEKNKIKDDPPFSLELKAEVNFIGKESLKFSALSKKMQTQCSYTGDIEKISKLNFQEKGNSATA